MRVNESRHNLPFNVLLRSMANLFVSKARFKVERAADCKLPNIPDKDNYTYADRPQKGIAQSSISSLFQRSNDVHIITTRDRYNGDLIYVPVLKIRKKFNRSKICFIKLINNFILLADSLYIYGGLIF